MTNIIIASGNCQVSLEIVCGFSIGKVITITRIANDLIINIINSSNTDFNIGRSLKNLVIGMLYLPIIPLKSRNDSQTD
jgi:hypothetical protein